MRELWQTGYMHNRVRMIVASFLVKDLRIHWRIGEEWFWIRSLMPIWQITPQAGNGLRDAELTLRPISGYSTPPPKAKNLIAVASISANGPPNSHKIKPILDHAKARDAALEAFRAIKTMAPLSWPHPFTIGIFSPIKPHHPRSV